MRTKVTFLVGFAAGYVLGTRAGRERYEQIRQAARAFASNPAVQNTASQLQHQATDVLASAKEKATGAIGDKLHEKRPAWISHGGTGATVEDTGWAAGSNGHVGS